MEDECAPDGFLHTAGMAKRAHGSTVSITLKLLHLCGFSQFILLLALSVSFSVKLVNELFTLKLTERSNYMLLVPWWGTRELYMWWQF